LIKKVEPFREQGVREHNMSITIFGLPKPKQRLTYDIKEINKKKIKKMQASPHFLGALLPQNLF